MIITVTLNPALERQIPTPDLRLGCVCEAGAPKTEIGSRGLRISGALRAMGGHSVVLTALGGAAGDYIRDRLDQLGICNDAVRTRSETRSCLRLHDEKAQRETVVELPAAALSAKELHEIRQKLDDLAEPGDTVLFAGMHQEALPASVLADWIRELRSSGVRTALDMDQLPVNLGTAAGPTLLLLGAGHFSKSSQAAASALPAMAKAARELTDQGVASAAVFLGREGLLLAGGGQVLHARGSRTVPEEYMAAGILLALEHGGEAIDLAACAVAAGSFADPSESHSVPTWDQVRRQAAEIPVERIL